MANTNDYGVNFDRANQGIDTTNVQDFATQTGLYTTAYPQVGQNNDSKIVNAYDNTFTYEGGNNWNAPGPGMTLQGTNVLTLNDDFNIDDPFYQNSGQGFMFAQQLAQEGGYRTADGTFHELTPEQIQQYYPAGTQQGQVDTTTAPAPDGTTAPTVTTTTDQSGGTTTTPDGTTTTPTLTPEEQAARDAAVKDYLDADTGSIRADLLGGQFTDPDTIPIEVLRERQDYRNRGYLGGWGTGAAGEWQTKGYTGERDAYGRRTIKADMVDQFNAPTLPEGGRLDPTLMSVQEGELLSTEGKVLDPNTIAAQMREANTSQAQAAARQDAQTYDATNVEITEAATIQGQLADLYEGFNGGEVPAWAAANIRRAEQILAARGMGASSEAGKALYQAAFESALPIAQNDAQVYAQALFTNAAAQNAAKQFNAQSTQQNQQFFSQLETSVSTFNADQKNAMERFNAGEANAISQFNAQMKNQREQFNANMRLQIDQSNAQWRRQINTANTAAINAANQFNAQNILDRSNQAMNNLWQDWRDQAEYAFKADQNNQDRATQIAVQTLMNQGKLDQIAANDPGIAGFVGDIFGKVVTSDAVTEKLVSFIPGFG